MRCLNHGFAVLSLATLFGLFAHPARYVTAVAAEPAPLDAWNDGPTKQAILDFVARATQPDGPDFVPPTERIVTFDNDGTLWVEQPMYTQVVFAFDRVKALAGKHPRWQSTEPFRSILSGSREAMLKFTIQDFEQVIAESHAGLTVEEFQQIARQWLATARHPRFKRPYTELVYQPMLEVMRYLRAHGFKTYIVTGGGQEFVRTFAEPIYGVPPEQVIGSAGKVQYRYGAEGVPELVKLPKVLLIDDQGGKPEGINLLIGRRPFGAFGNSTGDRQMLEWTQAGRAPRLMMLVRHDDAKREYDYGDDSKVGTFTPALGEEAARRGWHVISMKNDWRRVFGFEADAVRQP